MVKDEIDSESKFVWKFIFKILITPFTLLLMLFGKREAKDLFSPFTDLFKFIFQPKFTISIIILNIIISFLGFFVLKEEVFLSLMNYPGDIFHISRIYSLITSGFIHGSFSHLFFNMFAIFLFGRVVEKNFGFLKTSLIYFGALIVSSVGDSLIRYFIGDATPSLGASGAIMGLVAAAILIDPFYFTYELIIPMPVMIAGWISIYSDITGVLNPGQSTTAYFAHLFGYVSVMLALFFMSSEEKIKMKTGLIVNIATLVIASAGYFYFFV